MDCQDFCYYLQGVFEMNEEGLSKEQLNKLKSKLEECLKAKDAPIKPYSSGSGSSGMPPTYRC